MHDVARDPRGIDDLARDLVDERSRDAPTVTQTFDPHESTTARATSPRDARVTFFDQATSSSSASAAARATFLACSTRLTF